LSSPAYDAQPRCFKQLQTRFFRGSTVNLALSIFQTPQSQWILIRQDLKKESRRIPRIMKARGRKMRPNPLQNPFQTEAALQLFRQIAWEIFVQVMAKYDDGFQQRKWPAIFNHIYETELRHINACLGRK
ncbi:MAG: hypothetical protein ACE5GN_00040, partial [Waddliaceae bacterium]